MIHKQIYTHYIYAAILLVCLFAAIAFFSYSEDYFPLLIVLVFVIGAGSIMLIRHFEHLHRYKLHTRASLVNEDF